jgi:hypothetical protein
MREVTPLLEYTFDIEQLLAALSSERTNPETVGKQVF